MIRLDLFLHLHDNDHQNLHYHPKKTMTAAAMELELLFHRQLMEMVLLMVKYRTMVRVMVLAQV